ALPLQGSLRRAVSSGAHVGAIQRAPVQALPPGNARGAAVEKSPAALARSGALRAARAAPRNPPGVDEDPGHSGGFAPGRGEVRRAADREPDPRPRQRREPHASAPRSGFLTSAPDSATFR